MKKHLLSCIVLLSLMSCEKVIEFDAEDSASKIVLNGYVSPGELTYVELTASVPYTAVQADIESIEGASVTLRENETVFSSFIEETNSFNSTIYRLDAIPSELGLYEIIASKEGFETVNAVTQIPENAENLEANVISFNEEEQEYEVSITFSDRGEEENYYQLMVFEENQWDTRYLREFTSRDESLLINTSSEFLEEQESYFYTDAHFDDGLFDGQNKEIRIKIRNQEQEDFSWKIHLISCSEDYYLYHLSFRAAQNASGPFTQPVQVYSNVDKGIGVFAGYNTQEVEVEF